MRILSLLLSVVVVCQSLDIKAQKSYKSYKMLAPLGIPMVFAGSFGELRKTHFHSGVDFKTRGKEGYRVYSSEDGYISRISVSTSGYGNAVYITHTNGLLTVYGHLQSFNKEISEYLRDVQYKRESWSVNEYLPKNLIQVKRGDKIGLSGNTGSSMGPHLHYEIRDAKTQELINPFAFFDVKDNIRPKVSSLCVYDLPTLDTFYDVEPTRLRLKNKGSRYSLDSDTLFVSSCVGFGIQVDDFLPGSWNKCGIFSLEMYVNDSLSYDLKMDRFSFSHTRSVNMLKDMREDYVNSSNVYKTWLPSACDFHGLHTSVDNGLVWLDAGELCDVRIEVADFAGNKSRLSFVLKGLGDDQKESRVSESFKMKAFKDDVIECGDLCLGFRKSSLYADLRLDTLRYISDDSLLYSPKIIRVGTEFVPLKNKLKLALKVEGDYVNNLYIVRKTSDGTCEYVGGEYREGALRTRVSRLGDFALCLDTIPPSLIPKFNYNSSWLKRYSILRFNVEENQTFMASYRAEIAGQWVFSYFDKKNSQIICHVDKKRLSLNAKSRFVLTIKDACGNESVYSKDFYL